MTQTKCQFINLGPGGAKYHLESTNHMKPHMSISQCKQCGHVKLKANFIQNKFKDTGLCIRNFCERDGIVLFDADRKIAIVEGADGDAA